jgi:hypothetical protein
MGIDLAVKKALQFIKSEQQESGIFFSVAGESLNCTNELLEDFVYGEKKAWTYLDQHSVFPTLLIGNALKHIKSGNEIEVLLSRIDDFLLRERHKLFWVWNHFVPNHRLFKMNPYDIDSTVVALDYFQDRGKLPPTAKQRALNLLWDQITERGLFFTFYTLRGSLNCSGRSWILFLRELRAPLSTRVFWKIVEADRRDVDGVVNINVLHYLGRIAGSENVISYLRKELMEGNELQFDKWYKTTSVIYYFGSRLNHQNYTELEDVFLRWKEELMGIVQSQELSQLHDLDLGLMAVTMINLDLDQKYVSPCIERLLQAQQSAGNWKKKAFYFGGPKKIMGWGSDALTTAICIEALTKYKIKFGIN